MSTEFSLERLLTNGETRNTEFKRILTERDALADRRAKLVAQLKLITSEGEGRYVIGIEDLHGKKWEIYGLTSEEAESSNNILNMPLVKLYNWKNHERSSKWAPFRVYKFYPLQNLFLNFFSFCPVTFTIKYSMKIRQSPTKRVFLLRSKSIEGF